MSGLGDFKVKFFACMDEFKDQIVKLLLQMNRVDDVSRLSKHYEKILLLKIINQTIIIEYFYDHCIKPYYDEIITENEQYFMGRSDEVTPNGHVTEQDVQLIFFIRDIWSELDAEVKKNLWSYIKILAIYASKIMNYK
jgi:hypothetical protein